LLDCTQCGGQFVEHPLLKHLLRQRERTGAFMSARPPRAKLDDVVTYLPCPECAQLMNRKNFGGKSGIVVDVCTLHGVWFDATELAAVLAYVESGGPVEVKQSPPREPFKPSLGLGGMTRSEGTLVDGLDVGAAALELFAFVVDLVRD
jgi:Zn-finger nucleic acid-binding protein